MSVEGKPLRVLILAGPNGAGKTTFAREYLPSEGDCLQFVNADLIAEGLSPFAPEKAAIAAGKLMLEQIARLTASRQSFAFETTLSGRGYARLITQWQAAGYRVELHFLQLADADIAVARVKRRVLQGGHSIAESVIRRRHAAGWANFVEIYKALVDDWMVYDNTGLSPVLIAEGSRHEN